MSRPNAIPCIHGCGRLFGGDETLRRHRDNRAERCRSDRELRARGMEKDAGGVWRRIVKTPDVGTVRLFDLRKAGRRARRVRVPDELIPLPGIEGPDTTERKRETRQKMTEGASV